MAQMITLSESYVQIWQRTSAPFKDVLKGKSNVETKIPVNPTAGDVVIERVQESEGKTDGLSDQKAGLKEEAEKGNETNANGKEAPEKDVTEAEMHDVTTASDGDTAKGLKRKLDEQ